MLGLLCALQAFAQTPDSLGRFSVNRTKAIDTARSRAAQAADEMVSLSAEKIIALLRNETGLMLQVKKVLVQKAFEQGRIVDSKDLTDEAVLRAVQEDESVRILITREIENRYYVRVKPSKDELERGLVLESLKKPGEAAAASGQSVPKVRRIFFGLPINTRSRTFPRSSPLHLLLQRHRRQPRNLIRRTRITCRRIICRTTIRGGNWTVPICSSRRATIQMRFPVLVCR